MAATTSVAVFFNDQVSVGTAVNAISLASQTSAVAGAVQVSGAQAVFTPASPLALGTRYTVTVSTAVQGVDGAVLPGKVVSTFTTVDGSFQAAATRVSSSACGSAHAMGSDGKGNVLLAWLASAGGASSRVRTARFSPASGWTVAEEVAGSTAAELPAGNPVPLLAAAVGPSGDAFVAFSVRAAGADGIVAARAMASGGGWEAPRTVASGLTRPAAKLRLETDASGNAAVAWVQSIDGRLQRVERRFIADRNEWAAEFQATALSDSAAEPADAASSAARAFASELTQTGAEEPALPGEWAVAEMDLEGNGFMLGETADAAAAATLGVLRVSAAGYWRTDIARAPAHASRGFGADLAILDAQGRAMLAWCDPASDSVMASEFR